MFLKQVSKWMNIAKSETSNDVLFGDDGHLFLWQGSHFQFDFLLGKKKPSINSINYFTHNIVDRSKYLLSKNIFYRHIVFPSKPLVKLHFLPTQYKNIQSVFKKYYETHLNGEVKNNVLYPLDDLLKLERSGISTFKKLDTHNTHQGIELICNFLLLHLGIDFTKKYHYKLENQIGDLGVMLQLNQIAEEKVVSNFEKCNYRIGNRDFLPSVTNEIIISISSSIMLKKRLLIFGDSFSESLIPFLEPYFASIMYVRSSFLHKDIVEYYKPDIVITANAERYLSDILSDDEAKNILLELYGNPEYTPSKDYLEALNSELSYSYYPKVYEKYKEKIISEFLKPIQLSISCLIADIELIESDENSSHFISTGNDPSIQFDNIDVCPNEFYSFYIKIDSSINSIFQIFYTTYDHDYFLEENSIKKDIHEGLNEINIIFSNIKLGKKLRIDPLTCPGRIKIFNASLSTIYNNEIII